MSELSAPAIIPKLKSPAAAPTYWCVTCQLSLRSEDERQAHVKLFPAHRTRSVSRLMCPGCGNEVPLENGRYPIHWVGYGGDLRKCRCSGGRV